MSYRFEDSFRAGPGWNCSSILVLLESCLQIFRWFIPVVCDHNITIDIRWVSQNTTKFLLRCKESKDRQHVSALFYKAIIRSDMVN